MWCRLPDFPQAGAATLDTRQLFSTIFWLWCPARTYRSHMTAVPPLAASFSSGVGVAAASLLLAELSRIAADFARTCRPCCSMSGSASVASSLSLQKRCASEL